MMFSFGFCLNLMDDLNKLILKCANLALIPIEIVICIYWLVPTMSICLF